jgi:hypothetical protein
MWRSWLRKFWDRTERKRFYAEIAEDTEKKDGTGCRALTKQS